MDVLILLMFLGVAMVAVALASFAWTVRQGSLQHADRLALLPLRDDAGAPDARGTNLEKAADAAGERR